MVADYMVSQLERAIDDAAAPASSESAEAADGAVEETAASADQTADTDECRICRSSAAELLEADAATYRRCCCIFCSCSRRKQRQLRTPLHLLRCACTGSVRHVCARCYRRYYVARGLSACEICRQPTGIEGEVEEADGDDDEGGRFCRRLASAACSDEARFIIYALFLTLAFVTIFVLFFEANAADAIAKPTPSGTTTTSPPSPTQAPSAAQRRLERIIFVGVASVNLGIALAYICFSYWRHYGRTGQWCRCRFAVDADQQAPHRPVSVATSIPVVMAVGAVTVAIPQQPPAPQHLAVSV